VAVEHDARWVGFDLGGTKMMADVYDGQFNRLASCRKKTKGHEGSAAGLKRIIAVIEDALQQANVGKADLSGIGIGCPGPLDLKQGIVLEAPNLGWQNVPVKKVLEGHFKCPVAVANDVDAGVYGEYEFGAGKKARCVIGIFPGTGIGGGCVYEGNLLQGSNCTCMEIGHIPLLSDGPLDGLGNAGSLEAVASRLAVAASAAQAAFRGQAPWLMEKRGTQVSDIRSGDLAEAIQNGDEFVARIVEKSAQHIGLAIVTAVHLLAPDVVVLGGGLVEAMPELYLGAVRKTFRKRVLPSFRDVTQIVPAKLGDQATAMGAAAWAKKSLPKPVSPV
jgi:glucokinase